MQKTPSSQIASRVSAVTIIINAALSAFKLFAGIISSSVAMISDAVHSASDIISTVVVIIGIRLASKDADTEHQYGHERLECAAAIILSAILALTGIGIGISGIEKVFSPATSPAIPGKLALFAAILSIAVKEGMYWYTKAAADSINSGALAADAWHHRSDALSSVGSFAGILGARLGFPLLDPIAAVLISIFIIKAAIDVFRDSLNKMTDHACDAETAARIQDIILSCDGVMGIDDLKTRIFGNKIYIDVEIFVDANLPLIDAHEIAEKVHDCIESEIEYVKHCMVHINPAPQ